MRFLNAMIMAAVLVSSAQASKVKLWQHHAPAHYDKAKLKGAVVSSEGVVRLARQLKPLADIKADHVWDIVEDGVGNLYVATGGPGKVYKVSADGKTSVVLETKESQVLCLHLASDGALFAGTGPGGQVIRIDAEGKARVIGEKLGSYVWALASVPGATALFAGTGPDGRIYKVAEGKAVEFYRTKQDHVLCLASGPDALYAGTDKGGLVYRINMAGKGFVLHQAPQTEVRSLLVTKDFVYAGTSAPTKRGSPGSGPRPPAGDGPGGFGPGGFGPGGGGPGGLAGPPRKKVSDVDDRDDVDTDVGDKRPGGAPGEGKGAGPSPMPPPAAGDNSIYRIAHDGAVREIFRDKTLMLSLLPDKGRLLVGTGMNGQIFEVDETTRERGEVARLDHGQVHCLLRRKDGAVVLGTGDPGKLYLLEDRLAETGVVTSEVLDAKLVSKWGALSWTANTLPGTKLTIATRSGNVAEPDDTWSDWSAEQSDAKSARVVAPQARFLQFRATLSAGGPKATPELRTLAIRYQTINQGPEVGALDVPNLDTTTLDNPRKLKIRWTATDPNEDELTYRLYFRKEGWKTWVVLEDEVEKRDYDWDISTVPSGVYQVKVVASDRRDNGPDDALSGERVSNPFPVAHEPPRVNLKLVGVDGDAATIEASASDAMVRLADAAYAINGKRWTNVFPTDGLFDSRTETFRFKTEPLRPGAHVLLLRVRDAAGNIGTADVLFTVPARK